MIPCRKDASRAAVFTNSNRYRFSSKEWHPQSGLYLYEFRGYDPTFSRWLNEDPLGEEGGINLYRFVENDPLNAWDLFGLDTYRQNRVIGGNTTVPNSKLLSHTFLFTTRPDGKLQDTYSWGNSANPKGWNKNQPEDIRAAKEALAKRPRDQDLNKVGGASLDPFVEDAFNDLNKKKNEHRNLGVGRNCKTEADKLIEAAKAAQQEVQTK